MGYFFEKYNENEWKIIDEKEGLVYENKSFIIILLNTWEN